MRTAKPFFKRQLQMKKIVQKSMKTRKRRRRDNEKYYQFHKYFAISIRYCFRCKMIPFWLFAQYFLFQFFSCLVCVLPKIMIYWVCLCSDTFSCNIHKNIVWCISILFIFILEALNITYSYCLFFVYITNLQFFLAHFILKIWFIKQKVAKSIPERFIKISNYV